MISVRKSLLFLPFIITIILFFSCNKENEVGLTVQPASDQPGVIDTSLGLITYTVIDDSLKTNLSPYLFLGSLNDIETGKTFSSFYSQVLLQTVVTANTFSNATTPDAMVLALGYLSSGIYGNGNRNRSNIHRISVYQISETLSKDSAYSSTRDFTLDKMIGHVDIVPSLTDSIRVNGIKQAPQLRIPLDTALGGRFMRELQNYPTNDSLTKSFFKGIYVVDSVDGKGSILTFNASSSLNKMIIYYTNPVDTSPKTFDLTLVSGARSNRIKHEYCLDANVTPQVCNNNLALGQTCTYVQSLSGLKTRIVFPDWKQVFNNETVSIGKAELVLTIKSGSDADVFKPHLSLVLASTTNDGKDTVTADLVNSALGGEYNTTTKQYKLNITRHLQQILNGSVKDNGLYIASGSFLTSTIRIPTNARRTVLNGGSSMKLNITYTRQND